MRRRLAAIGSLVAAGAALVLALVILVQDFPKGVPVALSALGAGVAAWQALLRRGTPRRIGLAIAALLLAAGIALVGVNDRLTEDLVVLGLAALSVPLARAAFVVHETLPTARPPRRAVLFWNPRSGGGKATRFHLQGAARERGIEPVQLQLGSDLETLVRDAVAQGADGLAMAGGDGSQAIVAKVAAEHGLPYACIPAGTRNHFALDLGVDRDDVVGALDAFVDGGERCVDLAEVNGRVFVNNVSLGLYADAVQREGYRDAKLRTILDTLPEALGPGGDGARLRWAGPDGREESEGAAILVSNNAYRLGRAIGSGTRPRVDRGLLGVAVFGAPAARQPRPWREWTIPNFEVAADGPVNAGIDGEAAVLDPPLRFASRPRVLRVRVARSHPGASPSAGVPDGTRAALGGLARIALGRDHRPSTDME